MICKECLYYEPDYGTWGVFGWSGDGSKKLGKNDIAIVVQYTGPRLEEGATKLPKVAQIQYYLVRRREAL